jgi:microcystin-dependent protein
MSQPYIGEIRLVGFNFAPVDWAFCNGQIIAISQNEALFNLIGTTYGGDGQTTFALPNLCSRTPIHMGTSSTGTSYTIGEPGGLETVDLTTGQLPSHSHPIVVQGAAGNVPSPVGAVLAGSTAGQYTAVANANGTSGATLTSAGGGTAHNNLQPALCLNYIIALYGIFPSQG